MAHGAQNSISVACGLGQGTRGQQVGWPEFSPGVTSEVRDVDGARVRVANKGTVCCLFMLTATDLKGKPEGQPEGLPRNAVSLPMHRHRAYPIDLSKLANSRRKSAMHEMGQLRKSVMPRPANAPQLCCSRPPIRPGNNLRDSTERILHSDASLQDRPGGHLYRAQCHETQLQAGSKSKHRHRTQALERGARPNQ